MKEIDIEENELFPFYEIKEISEYTLEVFEITEEFYEKYKKNLNEFLEIQKQIKELYKTNYETYGID